MTTKKVSVVILNWNGSQLLRSYLPSVCRYTDSRLAEVVVADNGSDDDSLELLEREFPQVRVIAMSANSGFAEGYNIALREITSEYCVLLNSDVEVTEGWIEPLVAYADANPQIAALQPKIRSLRQPELFEYAGASGGFIDRFGFPFCRGRILSTVEKDQGQYDDPAEIFWATGACFFTRTDVYREVGGLDRHFFAHMEEIDLCWRYHLAGYTLVCVPSSVVYHLGGATLDTENPRKTYLNFRNNILMLYKNLPQNERDSLIFKRKLIDGIAAVSFLAKGKFANVRAVFNAHFDASKMIREHYQNLSSPQAYAYSGLKDNVLPLFLGGRFSIIIAYYFKGKKRFSQLLNQQR